MVWPYTSADPTGMVQLKFFRDRPFGELVCELMGIDHNSRSATKFAIAGSFVNRSLPSPARAEQRKMRRDRPALVNLSPKPYLGRYRFVLINSGGHAHSR